MRVERTYDVEPVELGDFAERYGLTMQLWRANGRYIAGFDGVYVQNGLCLLDQGGTGATEDEAIAAYARRIAGRRLVRTITGYHRNEQQEFNAPHSLQHTNRVGAQS